MSRCSAMLSLVLPAAILLCTSQTAQAQVRRVDSSQFLPGNGLADPGLFAGWLVNPAAIGLLPGAQLALFGTDSVLGGSIGLSLAALKVQLGLEALNGLGSGSFSAGGTASGVQGDIDGLRTGLGFALSDGRTLSLGFLWQRAFRLESLPTADLLSVGLLCRPIRWVSLAMAAHNLSERPFDPTAPDSQPSLDLSAGIAIRPGTERMSLGIDLHADRKGSYFDPSAFLAVRVIEGLDLGAGGWMSRIDDEWRWGAGGSLTLSLGSVSLTGGAGTGGGGTSWHYGARLSAPGEASAFAGRHRFVKMALPRSLGEQKRNPLFGEAPDTLLELRVRLHRLAHDGEVDGLLLILDSTLLGWAQSQEIARDITEIRQNGKSVVAYIVSGGNRDYYLASHADQIVVNPATIVSLTGISGSLTFFKDMLAAIGIEPQFVRIGRYKSYPEQFDRTGPSDASLEQTNAMLDDFYEQLVGDIARNRNVEKSRAREWIDQGPLTANRAKELGAIELIADLTDFRAVLDELGYRSPVLVDGYPFRPVRSDEWGPHPRVAVVSVVGTIVDGPSAAIPLVNLQLAGSATLVPTFDALAKDRSVDGVLVRIDSPGGAALASELINRALRRLAKAKPVVVSIGGTAASGGYYIAAASDRILAMRGSVTGSIGIWFGKFVISGLLDKLHVRRVPTDRGQHASIFSLDRRLTDEELEQLRIRLAEGYELFVSRILETRKFSRDELEEVAQGRVWSGGRAIANRLVDAEGGSLEALLELKGRMGLSSERAVDLVFLPASSLSVRISQALGGGMGEGSTDSESIDVAALLDLLGTPRAWAFDPHIPALTGF